MRRMIDLNVAKKSPPTDLPGTLEKALERKPFDAEHRRQLPILDLTPGEVLGYPCHVNETRIPRRRKCSRRVCGMQLQGRCLLVETTPQSVVPCAFRLDCVSGCDASALSTILSEAHFGMSLWIVRSSGLRSTVLWSWRAYTRNSSWPWCSRAIGWSGCY
jgi:hypothetical protein